MPSLTPARPIARLSTELRVSGLGQFALGLACLVASLTGTDVDPVRTIVPFAVAFLAGGALSLRGSQWLRRAAADQAPQEATVEARDATIRRGLIKVGVALILTGLAIALGTVFGVVFGGLVAAVGAVELRDYTWLRDREKASGREVLRELGRFPLAGGPRALYTRPLNESTLAT